MMRIYGFLLSVCLVIGFSTNQAAAESSAQQALEQLRMLQNKLSSNSSEQEKKNDEPAKVTAEKSTRATRGVKKKQ